MHFCFFLRCPDHCFLARSSKDIEFKLHFCFCIRFESSLLISYLDLDKMPHQSDYDQSDRLIAVSSINTNKAQAPTVNRNISISYLILKPLLNPSHCYHVLFSKSVVLQKLYTATTDKNLTDDRFWILLLHPSEPMAYSCVLVYSQSHAPKLLYVFCLQNWKQNSFITRSHGFSILRFAVCRIYISFTFTSSNVPSHTKMQYIAYKAIEFQMISICGDTNAHNRRRANTDWRWTVNIEQIGILALALVLALAHWHTTGYPNESK